MATDKNTIKNWFKTGLKPTQAQFWAWMDSYWHKDESISISAIENLEKVLDNKADNTHEHSKYATNDATSLTDGNILEWQKALKISDLKFDDKAITITQDYSDFGLEKGATINSFNNAIYQTVGNKLDAPTNEGTTADYPYVVGVNEDNESIKLPAGDLGKNFANTNLVVTENRKHTGTAIVEFGMPLVFSNTNQKFSGLLDKSSDATFNVLMGLDSNGNAGKLTALGNVLESGLKNITAEQGLRIGNLLNGGQGSTGSMTVYSVSPPIVQTQYNSVEWVLLSGTNLLLNKDSCKIELLDATTKTIELVIPTENIKSESSTELLFYYNFQNFKLGEYIIRITSGVKIYTTSWTLNLVSEVNNVDLNSITWDIKYKEGFVASSDDVYQGATTSLLTPLISASQISSSPIYVAKSNEIFSQGEDFYIEMNIDLSTKSFSNTNSNQKSFIGLGYSSSVNDFINQTLLGLNYLFGDNSTYVVYNTDNTLVSSTTNNTSLTIKIIKTGNLFRCIIGSINKSITLTNNSGYSIFHSILGRGANGNLQGNRQSIQTKIVRAFKFN